MVRSYVFPLFYVMLNTKLLGFPLDSATSEAMTFLAQNCGYPAALVFCPLFLAEPEVSSRMHTSENPGSIAHDDSSLRMSPDDSSSTFSNLGF